MGISLEWEEDFPLGYGHTSIAFLKRCPGFEDAKNGDLDAARFVASRCIKCSRLRSLREKYPNAVLIPVLGQNQLPLALAEIIGLPILYSVRRIKDVSRKSLCAIERLTNKPVFIGYVHHDIPYILVDDVVAQGGTVAALREFVLIQGGKVVAVVALAFAIGSYAVAPLKKYRTRLYYKFGFHLVLVLQNYDIASGIEVLTNSQVKYLLRFSNIKNIENKLSKLA